MKMVNFLNVFIIFLFLSEYTFFHFIIHCDGAKFKITNLYCESFDKSWVLIKECRLKAINRNLTTMNITLIILKEANEVYVNLNLNKKANGYKPFLINQTMDACQFMKKPNHPTFKLVYNFFKDYSTVNHRCPYVGEQYVRNLYLKPDYLNGLPLPSGDYLFRITWMFGKNKPIFVTNGYFTFKED